MDNLLTNLHPTRFRLLFKKTIGHNWTEDWVTLAPLWKAAGYKNYSPVSQYERPRAVTLASSACVDKTTKIITEFTRKDPFLRLKRVN